MLNRTYSSPNLKGISIGRNWDSIVSDEEDFYVIGDRVLVDGYKNASVAFFGEVDFAPGDWVGVVLDEPLGNHSGKVHGREYFQCAPLHGVLVRPHRVSRVSEFSVSNRASTPMLHQQRSYSRSPGSSTMGSYFYDEDYRQEKMPTLKSSTRKSSSTKESDFIPTSKVVPRAGILKNSTKSPNSTESWIGTRTKELAQRCADSSSPVFNFRPRRTQLDGYQDDRSTISGYTSPFRHTNRLTSVDAPIRIGDRVFVSSERGELTGYLRYLGETNFATGEWAGIELDEPEGKNDGSVLNVRYFHCEPDYGLFVPSIRIRRDSLNKQIFNSMRSTITSPPPFYGSYSSGSATPNYDRFSSTSSAYSSKRAYSPGDSSASPINPQFLLESNQYSTTPLRAKSNFFDSSRLNFAAERPKFDDRDIEIELKKSLHRARVEPTQSVSPVTRMDKPKAVRYTFSSSKYDGNPIAHRTIEYN